MTKTTATAADYRRANAALDDAVEKLREVYEALLTARDLIGDLNHDGCHTGHEEAAKDAADMVHRALRMIPRTHI